METNQSNIDIRKKVKMEIWGIRISSMFTYLIGLLNIISAVQPALQSRLAIIDSFIPLEVRHGGRITSALAGFALILIAGNLWRRKRVAWVATVLLLTISVLSHLIKGLDFEEASLTIGLLILLVVLRTGFHASSDRPSLRQGFFVLLIAFGFTLIYGTIGFYLLDRHFSVTFGLMDALRQTIVMFASFYNPGLEPITGFGKYFAESIYLIGFSTIGFAFFMLIRPVLVRHPATIEERKRAESIINQYGKTALARAALFNDKSYYFVDDKSVIAYAARGRGAIALGDPIGAHENNQKAIIDFNNFCSKNDWTPAFVSILPDDLDAYHQAGFDTLCIGYEAIVDLGQFSLEGGENKDLRYAVNRLDRSGFKAVVHLPPFDNEFMNTLHMISDAWLNLHHGGEMHFSDGWYDEKYLQSAPVIAIHGPDGGLTAFANLIHEYQKNEMTIDLMRHYPKVEYGTMEFLFVRMLLWAKENGYSSFSLGLSAIVGVGEKSDDPQVEKALHTISEYVSRFYNFKGLHNFKEKFHPDWQPRYIAYRGASSLPQVLTSLLQVHSGNNFVWNFLKK
jgi:phosphatidylglycerol lysyltransferase